MGKKQKILILFIIISIITIIFSNRYKNQTQQYNHENPYFYTSTEKKVEYEGYFYLWSYTDIWQNIHLNITELAAFENGILYTLELDQLNVTDPLDEINLGRRYLGYFYVTGQAIYYVSTKTMDGYTEAENREVIDQIQTNEAKFKKNSTVVCCENGTSDITDEQGYHAFVEVDGERRIFRYYNDYFYGSKDYMLMVWERGKGLVYYMHGNVGMNMHVEFGVDLEKEQQTDYGYPYKLFHDIQPDTADNENTDAKNKMEAYYGCYQITQFCPTIYYGNVKYDCLPEQEADMMLGRIVVMEEERLVTYDSERRLGTREGRNGFDGNYMIEEYTIENPVYTCETMTPDFVDFPEPDFYEQIENVIMIPQLCSPYGTQYFYTLSEPNKMVLYSTLTGQYFLLEKVNLVQEKTLSVPLSDEKQKQLLETIYGAYEVTEFLPTKFYPAHDSCGYEILPHEEVDIMLGTEVVISEEQFNTYDNDRQPNSWTANRLKDGFWLKKIEIENPEYHAERKFRKDIYGLRDDMLSEELQQEEYLEIDVYPGYRRGANTLPQLFLTENGKIIMYAMGEYFLLERKPLLTENEADSKDITQVISDYLQMDSFEFESHYKKDELYKRGILYCDKNAWKYDGSQLDAFQENNYNIENITAIRFYKKQSAPIYQTLNIGTQTSQSTERISIYYQTDYAVTIYRKPLNDHVSQIEEISFVKIKPDKGTVPEALYQFIENDYYDVRENLKNETWFPSPNGEKAVCISNGALPKHPAQIFIQYQDDKPYTIFRRTWEHEMVGWIDNDHFICYAVDVDTPVLVHLERNEIEPIITGKCQYDTYGVKYEIQENTLIAQAFGEQIYRWEIVEKDGEIMVVDVNVPLSALEESRVPDLTDYSAYLKKIWIVDGWTDDEMRGGDYPVTLVITNLENGQISGYLQVGGNIAYDYFALSGREKYISQFHGTIENGTAKCEYTESYKNKQGTITLTFQNDKVHHNDRIEVELEADAAQKYLLRPYNVFNESDVQFNEKLTTFEVELDSYGTGLIAYATMKCAHPYPRVFFVNHQGDILYEFSGSYRVYVNSTDVYDVLVADLNGDGRKDVKVMTFVNDLDNDEVGGEAYFYQEENGMFYLGLENDYYLDEPCRYCYSKEGELLYEINLAEKELEWNWVVKPEEYEDCFYLGENRIAVQKKNGYYGIINESGAFVFPEEYEEIGSYCEGIMRVRKKGAVYYIDRNGERITDTDFLDAHDFQEGKAAVMSQNGLWGVINRKGKAMTEFQWNEMRNFSEGLVAVQSGNKWGFINVTGESIIPCQYDEVKDFQEGYAAVRQGSQWGFVDRFGKKKIACQYDAVKDFQEGYAAVRREDKWGFINRKGEVSIAFLYDEAGSFSEGKAAVKRKNYLNGYMDAWAYINPDNAVVIDYDVYAASEGRMEYAGAFQDGMAFVSDGYYSIIDAEGNRIFDGQDSRFIISSFDYNKTYDAIPGYVYADDKMTIKKYGLVGLNGKQRLAPEFDYVHGIFDSYVLISQKIDGDWKYGIIKLQEESK